jgi:hypothetical protein
MSITAETQGGDVLRGSRVRKKKRHKQLLGGAGCNIRSRMFGDSVHLASRVHARFYTLMRGTLQVPGAGWNPLHHRSCCQWPLRVEAQVSVTASDRGL